MPLVLKLNEDNSYFGLWAISESVEKLKKDFELAPHEEKGNLTKFKNPNRQAEWIATRLLIYELLGKTVIIDYDEFGKPSIRDNEQCISISHTKGMVAVQTGIQFAGVDVELISGRVAKIAHKFLNTSELSSLDINNQMIHMYAHWGAKEAVYKIYGRKRLDFKENIRVEPFKIKKEGTLNIKLKTEVTSSYTLNYFVYNANNDDSYMVVKCCK